MEAIEDADMSGSDVGNHLRNEEGAELRTDGISNALVCSQFLLESLDTADTYSIHHAYAILVNGLEIHSTVLNGHFGGGDSELAIAVHLTGLLAVDSIVLAVEALHLAGKLCLEFLSVEESDGSSSADTSQQVLPRLLSSLTQGSEGSYSCYNNSFKFHK